MRSPCNSVYRAVSGLGDQSMISHSALKYLTGLFPFFLNLLHYHESRSAQGPADSQRNEVASVSIRHARPA
eukprot:scaffold24137_cov57-Phaeocystis_antarctica.AAC.2